MHGGIEIQTARRAVPGHPRNSKAEPSEKRHPKKIHIKIHTEFLTRSGIWGDSAKFETGVAEGVPRWPSLVPGSAPGRLRFLPSFFVEISTHFSAKILPPFFEKLALTTFKILWKPR